MGKPLIIVSSVTYARKGKEILFGYGIRSYVERIPKTRETGCGYGVYVPDRTDEAERILRENGIRVIERLDQTEDDGG